ncbi:MAG: hypothetical protein ACM3Q1_10110 [Bacteroidales bacterium]
MSFPRLEDLVEALRREVGKARDAMARDDVRRQAGADEGDAWFETRVASVRMDFNASVERVGTSEGKALLALRMEGPNSRLRQVHQVSIAVADSRTETVEVQVDGMVLRRYEGR